MIKALKDIHPNIASSIEQDLRSEPDSGTARTLFEGMFETKNREIKKGQFSQSLASELASCDRCEVPPYITNAINHVCNWGNNHEC